MYEYIVEMSYPILFDSSININKAAKEKNNEGRWAQTWIPELAVLWMF
jgi:hypothetical protein